MPIEIRHIRQSNRSSGCGPACVAMVAGVSEEAAIRAIFGSDRRTGLWTTWRQLKVGLAELGVEFAPRAKRVSDWPRIPGLSIVGLGRANTTKHYVVHWVVFDPVTDCLLDPARIKAATSAQCHRPLVSYLSIENSRHGKI